MITATSTKEDYIARLQVLDLIQEYASIVSSRDVLRYANLRPMYAPGGRFEGLRSFMIDTEFDEYVEYLVSLDNGDIPSLRQFIGVSRIEIKEDTASAVTPVLLITTNAEGATRIFAAGELHDSLVFTGNAWRFTHRRAVIDGAPDNSNT